MSVLSIKPMGPTGTKWLKVIHIAVMVMMLGGIMSSTVMRVSLNLTSFDEVLTGYRLLQHLSDDVIRWGAIGLMLSSFAYSIFTNWGFFKHRWVTVKWIIFWAQTIFGIVYIDPWMVANLKLLETVGQAALTDPVFLQNHTSVKYGAMVQIAAILFLIWVSVAKPWRKKTA